MYLNRQNARGFTLLELIIGIVVLAISFSVITSFLLPQTTQSANQIHQIRAAELGQSLMNEILSKAFDDNSDMSGGFLRCGEVAAPNCTLATALGAEEANREDYDDVDDYIDLDPNDIQDIEGAALGNLYQGYTASVNVVYDGNYDGADDGSVGLAKLITVTIALPTSGSTPETITFATYKANF